MKTVILQGQLGKKFGRRHLLDVKTAGEAVRALIANFPSIERHFIDAKCLGYRVKLHDTPLQDVKELHHPVGGGTITITPVISGAGRGFGQILLGAALIVAATFNPLAFFGGSALLTGVIGKAAVSIGVSLVLGGVSQMLAPPPKSDGPKEKAENQPSYVFNGAVNTTAQGQAVPVGYGRLLVGGAVISAGISTEEIPI